MAVVTVVDLIICTKRPDLARVASEHGKMKGISSIHVPDGVPGYLDALDRFPKGLVVLDWELGAEDVVKVLAHNRRHFAGQMRPTLLVAPQVTEQVIATAGEYSVSQIFAETLTAKNFGARLTALLIGEGASDEVKSALKAVHEARAGGDDKQAMQLLTRCLQKHPANIRLRCEAAETYLALGDPERAHRMVIGLEKGSPPNLRAINLLGRSLMRLGRFDEALLILEKATLFNPFDAERLVDIGEALLQVDRTPEASARFAEALAQEPKNKRAKVGQSEVKLLEGAINEALTILKDCSGEAETASVFNTCAILCMRRGRFQQGMDLYMAAMKVLKKKVRLQAALHFNMGLGYRRWGKKDKAAHAFNQALSLDPKLTKAQQQLDVLSAAVAEAMAGMMGDDPAPAGHRPTPPTDKLYGPITDDADPAADSFGFDDFNVNLDEFAEEDDELDERISAARLPA